MNVIDQIRLTSLCHGGGCGCKIAPEVLSNLLAHSPFEKMIPQDLMVGIETSDDAAVYRLNEQQALILTTDFFLPVVDDPHDFGCIAATNAISDVYAMGGNPILALAVVGMPVNKLPPSVIRAILHGGESVCRSAGIPIAGGHSIDSAEPFYGLVVAGLVHPDHVRKNSTAHVHDRLLLCKPLGVGIYSAALRKDGLSQDGYQELIKVTTQLNILGKYLGQNTYVHALTDVTGFGLPGHLLEICRGSQMSANIYWERLPWLSQALSLAENGYITGASQRNWQSYGQNINVSANLKKWQREALCDPQTSGGLLISVSPQSSEEVKLKAEAQGFICADIGEIIAKQGADSSMINIL